MKKIFAIFMAVCLMASVICVTAFAADNNTIQEPAADIVLRATALKRDGKTIELIGDYKNFEDGWNAAMEIAESSSTMRSKNYDRIIVDIYKDWVATDGVFTDDWWSNGPGFDWDTIYFPDDSRVTLNLNGHTIDRDLQTWEIDGEVLHIDEDADVIINNGTVTGGWSRNGGGGIYLDDDAKLVLNDVHIKDNIADIDCGGGISICSGATLIMNGGSFEDNVADSGFFEDFLDAFGGAIYAEKATINLTNVEFKNNRVVNRNTHGAAIYATYCEINMDKCTVVGNGKNDEEPKKAANSIFFLRDCDVTIKETTFTDNGTFYWRHSATTSGNPCTDDETSMFWIDDTAITLDTCTFTNNKSCFIFYVYFTNDIYATDTTFIDNTSVIVPYDYLTEDSYFRNCKFDNNSIPDAGLFDDGVGHDFYSSKATFYDCDFGDSTTFGVEKPNIVDSDAPDGATGSILGEGSITMIVAILALVTSVAAVVVNVYTSKKKLVPANNADESEEE